MQDVSIRIRATGGSDAAREISQVGQAARKMGDDVGAVSANMATLAGSVATALGGLVSVGKLVEVQREFDVLNASLITMTGSSANAARAFADLQNFAASTPFSVAEVTQAFVKMKALGLDPTMQALESYGNTSSAMGKSLMQLVEAIADATTGEFERLKEFGIKASKEGGNVEMTFRGITKTIENSASSIEGYLQTLGRTEFAGAMAERAKTLDGAISNLADSWDSLWLAISKQGIGDAMLIGVQTASAGLSSLKDNIETVTDVATVAAVAIGTRYVTAITASAAASAKDAIAKQLALRAEIAYQQAIAGSAIGIAGRTAAINAATAATAQLTTVSTVASRALGLFGGPIGLITTALSLGATAWMLWGNKADEATRQVESAAIGRIDAVIGKLAEMQGRIGSMTAAATKTTIGEAETEIRNVQARTRALSDQLDAMDAKGKRFSPEGRSLQTELDGLYQREVQAQRLIAQARADSGKAGEDAVKRFVDANATGAAKVAADRKRLQDEYNKIIADAGGYNAANPEHVKALTTLNAKLADLGKSSAGAKAARKEIDELGKSIERGVKLAGDLAATDGGLNADFAEKWQDLASARKAGAISADELVKAQARLLDQQPAIKQAREDQIELEKQYVANVRAAIDPLEERARAAERELETYGQSEAQIQAVTVARMEEVRAIAAANGASPEHLAYLDREIELRKRIASATGQTEARDANKKAAEQAAQDWQRVSDDIGRALTDAIFSGGKDGWELLVDTIKATVIRAYVQPVIQNGINSVLGSVIGAPAGQGATFGGIGNLVGLGAQAAGLSGLGAYTGAAGFLQLGSMASSFSTGLSAAAAGADLTAAIGAYQAAGMGATATSLGAGASAAGALGSSAGLVSGALSGVMTATPYLAAGMLIAQQLGAFNGPTYHKGGAYLASTDGTFTKATNATTPNFNLGWGAYTVDRSSGYDDAMLGISAALAKQISTSIEQYGGQALDLTIASRFASDNDDWSEGAYRVMDEWGNTVVEMSKRYTKDANKALTQFGEDSSRVLLAALQKTDLADEFDALFSSLDPFKASVAEINQLFERASAIQQQIASINGGIDAAFLSPAEQLDKAFAALGQSIPGTVHAYEDLVRAQDLQTSAGRDAAAGLLGTYQLWGQVQAEQAAIAKQAADEQAALNKQLLQMTGNTAELRRLELEALDPTNRALQERIWALEDEAAILDKLAAAKTGLASAYQTEASALQSTVDRMRGFATGLRDFRDSLLLGSASPLTPGQQYDEARRQFEATYAKAMQGDETALQGLQQSASAFLEASRTYNASGAGYTQDFEAVRAALGDSAIGAAAAADVAQLQLNVVKDQLKLLGDIDEGVGLVADAMQAFSAAVLQAIQAGANPGVGNVSVLTGGQRDQWVSAGAGLQAWQSLGGATATQTPSGLSVQSLGGQMYSAQQLISYWHSGLSERQIYDSAKSLGITLSELNDFMGWPDDTAERWARDQGLPVFARGGYHAGGLALVGEQGPEIVNFEAPAQILDAARTRDALSGTGSSADLVRELQTLRAEVRALREQQRAETAVIVEAQFGAADRNAQAIAGAQSVARWAATTQPEIV